MVDSFVCLGLLVNIVYSIGEEIRNGDNFMQPASKTIGVKDLIKSCMSFTRYCKIHPHVRVISRVVCPNNFCTYFKWWDKFLETGINTLCAIKTHTHNADIHFSQFWFLVCSSLDGPNLMRKCNFVSRCFLHVPHLFLWTFSEDTYFVLLW